MGDNRFRLAQARPAAQSLVYPRDGDLNEPDRDTALGCRDVARLDFRMDGRGRPRFVECNARPGLAPGWSDLVLIAQAAGIEYPAPIGEILSCALQRCTPGQA